MGTKEGWIPSLEMETERKSYSGFETRKSEITALVVDVFHLSMHLSWLDGLYGWLSQWLHIYFVLVLTFF